MATAFSAQSRILGGEPMGVQTRSYCYRLHCSLPSPHKGHWSPNPWFLGLTRCAVTLLGHRVFADDQVRMRSLGQPLVNFLKKIDIWTHRKPRKEQGEDTGGLRKAPNCQKLGEILLFSPQKMPWPQISGLQNFKTVHFCYLSSSLSGTCYSSLQQTNTVVFFPVQPLGLKFSTMAIVS